MLHCSVLFIETVLFLDSKDKNWPLVAVDRVFGEPSQVLTSSFRSDDPTRVILAGEAQVSATRSDAQYLVRGAVEVTGVVHRVVPVRDYHTE